MFQHIAYPRASLANKATLDLRHPRLHRFTTYKTGVTRKEIYTGHTRAFFGLSFRGRGIGISFPVVLHISPC